MSDIIAPVLAQVDAALQGAQNRLDTLLRIPSISAQPAHKPDCEAAANWLARELQDCGFEASVRQTPGHPIVVAHDRTHAAGLHVLFYGHYDVQPVDPLELWKTPPFEPSLVAGEDGRLEITARGASDDKGQLMTFIEAIRAIRAMSGELPLRVSFIIEGEEESGGENLLPFLLANSVELKADVALICDTGMASVDVPAITTGLRGLVGEEIVINAANRDLHSGLYGNAARNPIEILCSILGDVRDQESGRVTLAGFYDNVTPPPELVRTQWREIAGDDAALLGPVGLSLAAGEKSYSALEQTWCRPSFEINGISGGYAGDGFKTVLPACASAKVSFRLVPGQDPDAIRLTFRSFVRARIPQDCSVTFHEHGGSSGFAVPSDGPYLQPALAALTDEWGKQAVVIGSGGSIPVVSEIRQALGIDSLMVGFAQADDRIHSPNEKYDLRSFHKGIRSWVRILYALARTTA